MILRILHIRKKEGFRPLDGESISKLWESSFETGSSHTGFRPLDGESISKPDTFTRDYAEVKDGFRPLDGESISKRSRKQVNIFNGHLQKVSVP